MEDCYDDGIDEWRHPGNSDCGGSDDLTDDFDRQELEWALYSQIHHEEADDSKAHSKSLLEEECDINITEDGETSKNSREITSSTPKTGKTGKKTKRKTLDKDSVKTSKDVKKKPKQKKKKSPSRDDVVNLEALLVLEPSKVTPANKKHDKTEGAELSKHAKKQKRGDKCQKSKGGHKKGNVTQEFIVVSSDNSDASDSERQTRSAVTENGDCAGSDSNSDYSFGDMHAEEKMDIQLNINDLEEDNRDITVEDIHKSLGGEWDIYVCVCVCVCIMLAHVCMTVIIVYFKYLLFIIFQVSFQ